MDETPLEAPADPEQLSEDAALETLTAEEPAAVGIAAWGRMPGHIEGARLLADQAVEPLRARRFTDEQILEWAEAYIATCGSGDVDGLIAWIRDHERDRGA